MRQLTIFCSGDEEPRVVSTLDRAGIEGFLRLGNATGNKFLEEGRVPRSMSWEAVMLVVPAAADDRVRKVVEELGAYARNCEIEPCLRMVVSNVEEVF